MLFCKEIIIIIVSQPSNVALVFADVKCNHEAAQTKAGLC